MLARAYGATLHGVDGVRVVIEVDAGRGLPSFQIVGQGDRVVNESRDRIRAAFRHSGLEFPPGRVTVNLAPTGVPKSGSGLDLGIAVAIAATSVEVPDRALADTMLLGELGLDGALRGVRGTLALLSAGTPGCCARAVVPLESLAEASVCPGVRARGAETLGEALAFLRGERALAEGDPGAAEALAARDSLGEPDLSDVRGQETARRALEVAAAGGHNLLLVGPPGGGKTLLARRLPSILPDLEGDAALEATRIHGVAGTLGGRPLLRRPPFRAPHHTASDAGLAGGGHPLRPGEISLAHRGVLFLDELAEFRRPALESLRQPLEEGVVRITRAHGALELPARFQLIAATNPCPCGFRGDPVRECECDDAVVRRYRAKLSGPLLDRIDLRVDFPRVPQEQVGLGPGGEPSAAARARVERARRVQAERYAGRPYRVNADLPDRDLHRCATLTDAGRRLLARATHRLGFSMRAEVRVLRVARTIADLDQTRAHTDPVDIAHLAEAIGYR